MKSVKLVERRAAVKLDLNDNFVLFFYLMWNILNKILTKGVNNTSKPIRPFSLIAGVGSCRDFLFINMARHWRPHKWRGG